jgi:DNA polymerase III delta prime subunit
MLFINKYQPLYFKDFEVDNEILNMLQTLITMNNLNILFIGDIGSGKTSFLNAAIREYYIGLSPSEYESNILHINSLKEQGINYYRNDVKIFCQTSTEVKGKKKIVILDDIDLINEQSQQVFRNCIDKYSHNVHFICSCSNTQKVIESLQSRLSLIKIKPLDRFSLSKIMNKIKRAEKIHIDPDAREFILNVCNNTAKILINYMEKFKLLDEPITLDLASKVCTNISFFSLRQYTQLLLEKKVVEAIKLIYSIYDNGYSVMDILDNYFLFIKTTELLNEEQKYKVIPLICKYITVFHNIHEDEIELSLFTNNMIGLLVQ